MSEKSQSWSRRNFVKTTAFAGVALQMPLWWSCVPDNADQEKLSTLQHLLKVIFPNDEYGPGALDFNADRYILWWLKDERIDPVEINFVQDHLNEINESDFPTLSNEEKEKQIYDWASSGDHQNFLSKLLSLTFEALVAHPNYGFNEDYKKLQWIEHAPGVPQPSESLIYPQIFKTIHND